MLKYLALGDSYTIGEDVAECERWPTLLAEKLRGREIALQSPHYIATTGWTTGELLSALERVKPSAEWDLVSLLIGVNNQYRGYDLDIFREEFTSLVQKAIYFARKKPEGVFVLSIPDYGVTPFAAEKGPGKISYDIDIYNALVESICRRFHVLYFNVTDISRQAAQDLSLLANDQLHPSGKMYAMWTERILANVVNQIRLLQKV